MSVKELHAGDGYQYLLRTVADSGGDRRAASPMTRYYAEAGTPPGRWLGTGLAGLAGGRGLAPGSEVTAEQMERLFKHGRDPVTGGKLTRRDFPVPKPLAERIATRIAALPGSLPTANRAQLVAEIEADEKARPVRRPVAGFDLTFSPSKSVSALWAVADHGLREQITEAHYAAMRDTLAIIERDVLRTRVGTDGIAQVDTRGAVAAAFDHWDSRTNDPQLHTHLVIANRVQGEDGAWRTLDSRGALFPAAVAMSETYDTLLADQLTARLGLGWDTRGTPRKPKNQAWEITGVPDELIRLFSTRRAAITARKDELIAQWRETNGRDPDDVTVLRLAQQATLATRKPKTAKPLAELTTTWRDRARRVLGRDPVRWASRLTGRARVNERGPAALRFDDLAGHVPALAAEVIGRLSAQRSTWRPWNINAETARVSMRHRMASTTDRQRLLAAIQADVATRSVTLSPPELAHTPAKFRRPDGTSAFRPATAPVFTTAEILAAETRLLAAARTDDGPGVDPDLVDDHLTTTAGNGPVLADDQAAAIGGVACSGRRVDVLVGAAGTGKTTTLAALRTVWETVHGHGSVIGLAPSAAAADVLADTLGVATENTAKWLVEHAHQPDRRNRLARLEAMAASAERRGAHQSTRQRRQEAAQLRADIDRWQLEAGQLVIVDEASLAGTLALDTITTHAQQAGAKVLLVGDWAQLSAVDAGGAFGLLVRDRGDLVPELTGVRRFNHPWERAASLRLRLGDQSVITDYQHHGRITDGDPDAMLEAAYTAWLTDQQAGKRSLLIAGDTTTVTELNTRSRADLVAAGQVQPNGVVLHDGTTAGVGDLIVSRRNDRHLATGARGWVKNGDTWTITHHYDDGSLGVRRATGGPVITLPAAYVAEHVELGYATTAHRAQGATVDVAHAIVTGPSMTREAFYVAMTRARHANHAYVCPTHQDPDHDGAPHDETWTGYQVLAAVLRNSGAELSAHETIRAEQDAATTIARLAAEYDTIAREAHTERWAALTAAAGLDPDTAAASPAWPGLVAAYRRADAYHLNLDHTIGNLAPVATHAGTDPVKVLRDRVERWWHRATTGATRPAQRMIAGLVPAATGITDPDMRRALHDREELMESRATELVQKALGDNAPWLEALGPPPDDHQCRAAWQRFALTVAAYRDRWDITDTEPPLGPGPGAQWTRRADHRRAAAAITDARRLTRHGQTPAVPSPTARPPKLAERHIIRDL